MAGSRPALIVEGEEFCRQRDELAPSIERWDEAWRAVEWILARKPDAFMRLGGKNLFLIKLDPNPLTPGVLVFFRLDGAAVHLTWCEEAPWER